MHGHDRSIEPARGADPEVKEAGSEIGRVFPQPGNPLRLGFEDLDRGKGRSGHCGGQGIGEELGAGALHEVIRRVPREPASKPPAAPPQAPSGGGSDDVDLAVESEMLGRATSVAAEDAGGMRVVEPDQRAMLFGTPPSARRRFSRSNLPSRRRHQLTTILTAASADAGGELLVEVSVVAVAEDTRLTLGDRLAEAEAVDDRRVIELIGKNECPGRR